MISQTLDLMISMVTVILLASLLFGSVYEWMASYFNSRGKFLQNALSRLFQLDNGGHLIGQIYAHPAIRLLSNKTELPSYIPDRIFAQAILDVILQNHQTKNTSFSIVNGVTTAQAKLNSDHHQLLADAIEGLEHGVLKDLLSSHSFRNGADVSRESLEQALMQWYNLQGQRVTGWYKRNVQSKMIKWTLLFCMVFNFNPITIYKEMKVNTELRTATIAVAEKLVEEEIRDTSKIRMDSVKHLFKELQTSGLPFGYEFSDSLKMSWDTAGICEILPVAKKMGQVVWKEFNLYNFIGWMIGALLLTVQSGFWFELLARFINIRKGGLKPASNVVSQNSNV